MRVGQINNFYVNRENINSRNNNYFSLNGSDYLSFCSKTPKNTVSFVKKINELLKKLFSHNKVEIPLSIEEEFKMLENDRTIIMEAFNKGTDAVNQVIKNFQGRPDLIDDILANGAIHCQDLKLASKMINYFNSKNYQGGFKDKLVYHTVISAFCSASRNGGWHEISKESKFTLTKAIYHLMSLPNNTLGVKSKDLLHKKLPFKTGKLEKLYKHSKQ